MESFFLFLWDLIFFFENLKIIKTFSRIIWNFWLEMFHNFLLESKKHHKNAPNIKELTVGLNKRKEKFTELWAPLSIELEKTVTNSYANRKRSANFSGWFRSFINSAEEPEWLVSSADLFIAQCLLFSSALLLAIFFLHSSKDALSTWANKEYKLIASTSSFFRYYCCCYWTARWIV